MSFLHPCFLFLSMVLVHQVLAQQPSVPESDNDIRVVIKAHAKKDSILLRWGVNDKMAWKYGIRYGYLVERRTITRDGEPVTNANKVVFTGGPIRPRPLQEWESLIQGNDMAAVAAQAIYGEDFNVNKEEESLFMKVVNQSSELEQRFGFSMFAVDQDFTAAQYAGLGYVDANVDPREQYLYTVKLAAPDSLISTKEKSIFIAPSKLDILPKPYDFSGYSYNNTFVLIWEYDGLLDFYTSYDLEKSKDGTSFSKINDAPITKLDITEISGISYTDSVQEYGKKYWYRIRGRTLFNELGPPSDTVSLIAYRELEAAPEFTTLNLLSEKEVILNWEFPKNEDWKLTGFDILRAEKPNGLFEPVGASLEKTSRSFPFEKLQDINYFKVRAKGIAGDVKDSRTLMIQPIDSIPPLPPSGLTGNIDTLGVVTLSWKSNTELDLKGYTLFRANRANQEFTRLHKQELIENSYRDTINLKTFNEKVYYKLMAVDHRHNESRPSEVLELVRPSMIPPANPLFTFYEVKGDTVSLEWEPSIAEDIKGQAIYRKQVAENGVGQWQKIWETEDSGTSEFADTATEKGTKYLYTIIAVGTNGLESDPSPPLSITTSATLMRPKIRGFSATANREDKYIQLNWRYREEGVIEIQLYRKTAGSSYSLYKTFATDRKQFVDMELSPNTTYSYGIKAIFKDGSQSEWEELEVNY